MSLQHFVNVALAAARLRTISVVLKQAEACALLEARLLAVSSLPLLYALNKAWV